MLRRNPFAVLAVVVALVAPPSAWPDAVPTLQAGIRVRVTPYTSAATPDRSALRERTSGSLLALDAASLTMTPDAAAHDTLLILRSQIERLEVSRGRKGHGLAGLGIGLGIGAGSGALIGSASSEWPALGAAVGAVLFGLAGGFLGLLVGSGMRSERWSQVPLEEPAPSP